MPKGLLMQLLLYVVNIPRFFVSHRLPLALAARDAGYDVHIATSDADVEHIQQIIDTGLPFHPLPLSQHGTNPLDELRTIHALVQLYRRLKPDIVHQVSIKPVLYGGIAARIVGVRRVVSAMSGLGYVFTGTSAKARLLRLLVTPVFRAAVRNAHTRMIFQNPDDRARFIQMGLVDPQRAALIRGSGVDMAVFSPQPEPEDKPLILFAGRLMWKKGIGQFVEAAQALKDQARFVIVGYAEATSPDHVPSAQLEAWSAQGCIEWWGKRDDMPDVFAQCHVVCLPSSYGEGVPKVLIEAAACGRAIVTTDTPGCREVVQHEVNGLLVPVGDTPALIAALTRLIQQTEIRQHMGRRGRERATNEFSLETVVQQTFDVYEL